MLRQRMVLPQRRISQIAVFLLASGLGLGVPAAAQTLSGVIAGTVADAQGGVLPGVTLTLRNTETGVTQTRVSGSAGEYRLAGLPPGRYDLSADLPGFARFEVTGLTLTLGLELRRDFTMTLQAVQETVTVTAQAAVVETTRSEVSGAVSVQQIEQLPVANRQPVTLLLLLPGVTDDSSGNRRSPSLSIGAGGAAVSQTTYTIDGGWGNTGSLGSTRQNFPQAAIQEFKAYISQSPADIGGTVGGSMVMVTKSGTNLFSGEVFEFFRDKSLNAMNTFEQAAHDEFGTPKPDFRRHQFGVAVGGPVLRDRLHFFATVERTTADRSFTVATGQPQFYSALEGIFPVTDTDTMYLVRGDFQITPQQTLFVRHAYEREVIGCETCGGNTAAFASFHNLGERDSTVIGHTWVLGSRWLNEIRVHSPWGTKWSTRRMPPGVPVWPADRQFEFPPERFEGKTAAYEFPSVTWGSATDILHKQPIKEFRDDFTYSTMRNNLKVGFGFWTNTQPEAEPGNPLGEWTFATDQFFDGSAAAIANLTNPIQFQASFPPITREIHNQRYYVYVQDDWRPRSDLTINLGLRYDINRNAFDQTMDLSGREELRQFIPDYASRGDHNNIGPRTGFAWDVRDDGRSVVRGGYGVYYQLPAVNVNRNELDTLRQNQISIQNPSYPDPYQGRDPLEFVSTSAANVNIMADDIRNAKAQTANVGFSQELKANLAIHIDATYTRMDGLSQRADINTRDPVTGERPFSGWGFVRQTRSTGEHRYRALYVRLDKRFADGHQYLVSYALSRERNNGNGNRGTVTDFYNPDLDWGPGNSERRHMLTASGSVALRYDVILGAVWTLHSARPFSAIAGTDLNRDGARTDFVPGTTRNQGNRDLDLSLVNAWRAENGRGPISADHIDKDNRNLVSIRASKAFHLGGVQKLELIAQVFNALGTVNLADVGSGYVTNALSGSFGRILSARAGRQGELAVRFAF